MSIWNRTRKLYDTHIGSATALHRTAIFLLVIGIGLMPWLIILGATLPGQTDVRMWSSTWIGFDCLEIVGLITTAAFLMKRKALVIVSATFTATLFLIDAWFDVMLAQAGSAWYQALASAFLAELPLSITCFYIALTAPAWIRDAEESTATARKLMVITHNMHDKRVRMRTRKNQ